MTCKVCGQATLFDGVCIDCSNKSLDDYPRLKAMENRLNKFLDERMNDLDKRLSHWTNCTPMGNSAYNMLMREFETCKEVKALMTNEIPKLRRVIHD